MSQTIQRLRPVLHERGRSRSSHYLDIQQGLFTCPVLIGLRAVGWPSREVEAINAARIAGKSDEEIRALVVKLEGARKMAYRQPSLGGVNENAPEPDCIPERAQPGEFYSLRQ